MEDTSKFSKALSDMKTIVKSLFEKKDEDKSEMLAAVKDDNGNLLIIPEAGIVAGEKLEILQEDGSIIPAPDGDYFLEGQIISVLEGVITEVKPIPEEEDITEEVAEDIAEVEDDKKEFEDVAGEADLTELRENMNEVVGMMQEVVQFITTLDERVMRLEARSEATEQYTALMERIEKLEETPMAESIKKNKKISVNETVVDDKYITKLRNLRNK